MSNNRTDILLPPGRLVSGSLYEPNTTDDKGQLLVHKSGPNKGQPGREEWYFAVAIPKSAGQQAWWQKPADWDQQMPGKPYWGEQIMNVGRAGHPAMFNNPAYSWKIKDGDSRQPNRKGRIPAETPGWAGCWVLHWTSGYAPKLVRDNGTAPFDQKGAIMPGDWIQVFGNCDDNGASESPGVYLNHQCVNFIGYGQRINIGIDPRAVGFGTTALPPGASLTPPAGSFSAPVTPPAAGGMPAMPSMGGAPAAMPMMPSMGAAPAVMPGMPPMGGAPAAMPAMPGVPATVVQPNPAFLQPGGMPAMPGMPVAAAPAAPVRQLTAKAGGYTYEQLIGGGWTDATLIQQGLMVA